MSINHSHLPNWLANNAIFRQLFLMRKLFLTKKKFSHYGQAGEDIAIGRFFSKGYKGFFVDVGCFHPTKYNNTYKLYKKGWRGINIDIDSIKIQGFNIVRPGDTNIACAISNQSGEVKYYTNGFYSPTVTLEENFTESEQGFAHVSKENYVAQTTRVEPLSNIIDETKYKDQPIDLLSVDVEGHDYVVLQTLDFNRYRPQIIAIESHLETLPEVEKSDLYLFLKEKNYQLVNWVGLTLIFKKIDLP